MPPDAPSAEPSTEPSAETSDVPSGSGPLDLAASETGTAEAGAPVVILHGLFGSATNWRGIAQKLGERHRVVTLDLRNHGASPWADEMSYAAMAADVAAAVAPLGPVTLIGHSMGGKVAMTLALTAPALVGRLVVADIAPVTYPPTLLGHVRAMRAIDPAGLRRRADADQALRASIPEDSVRAFLLQNLAPNGEGGFRWRLNLAAIEAAMPLLVGWTDPPGARPFHGPTLFVSGERSDYMRPQHRAEIRRLFRDAGSVVIPDAGHWLHAEKPQAFLAALALFLGDSA